MVTARELWRDAVCRLKQMQVEDAEFDAAQLVYFVTGLNAYSETGVPPESQTVLDGLLERRCHHEPLQYLLGEWDFLDLTLCVGPGVLIPRPDTELVAQQAIEAARKKEAARVVDLCSGSGAIALAVACHVPDSQVTAVELSSQALKYLDRNNQKYGSPLRVVQADVLCWDSGLEDESFDIIVSNPPYISPDEMQQLAPELAFEPRMALEAGERGLEFYSHIAPAYFSKLSPGGVLIFEIGWLQGKDVSCICQKAGYIDVTVLKDLGGRDRCVCAKRPRGEAIPENSE
ncbi:peptide chain release factor N(5)-glutamine methyltransferase [uncultured Ruthenibacterium sp.]|uniref:peptide chain release factor N(5)-glutamine methyltransferase n=1 Tax=uncultured Ruthenibacterium sp. TaxID=1905347 RepID=UPI00349EBF8D